MSASLTINKTSVVAACVALGIVLRFALALRGHNFDLESYRIVSEIVTSGGNVYAQTSRYNYGPIWFGVIGAIGWLTNTSGEPSLFRGGIIAMLTVGDLVIAFILYKRFSPAVALLFFLNPVSIIITGYHNQFDNVAVALGLCALLVWERRPRLSLVILGLSLVVKHIFFLLPLWLAYRAPTWRGKALAICIPTAIFALSFLPFVAEGADGILKNVISYRSFQNGVLYQPLVEWTSIARPSAIFIVALAAMGWLLRSHPLLETGLLYLVALVVLSPSSANQYLAIPMAAVAAILNVWFAIYAVTATLLLLVSPDGLHINFLRELFGHFGHWLSGSRGYGLPVLVLLAGLWWHLRIKKPAFARAPVS